MAAPEALTDACYAQAVFGTSASELVIIAVILVVTVGAVLAGVTTWRRW